jgi:hypothetical protein
MKQHWKWVIVGIIASIIGIGIYISTRNENKYFNKVELNGNNFIRNKTQLKYLDTVLKVGLDVLEINGVIIFARPITIKSEGDLVLKAHIVSAETPEGIAKQFLMEIDKSHKGDIIGSISHELIHLQQYHSGDLKVSENYVIWKGDTLVDNIPEYFDRPWEIEAKEEGRALEREIRGILIPK